MTTEQIYNSIMGSSVFRTDGPTIDLCQSLIDLAAAVKAEEETAWHMGEGSEATLDCLFIGAFWALSEWHAGQWSPEYAALSALGGIFSPGCTCPPTEEEPEYSAYELIGQHFAQRRA